MNMQACDAHSRFSPWQFRGNKTVKNRVVVPPMASQTATTEGFITQETLQHYKKLSEADSGILMVEYTYVHPSGRSEENQLGIATDEHVDDLTALASLIKKSGALAGIQLSHGGAKSTKDLTGGILWGPSEIAVPSKDNSFEIPKQMNGIEIKTWKDAFLSATERAVRAGFELVEFHSAHGYGLNQWLSPLTNQRTDSYGGTLEGRAKLLCEIISSVRERFPHLILSARIPGQDFLEGGLSINDSIKLVELLKQAGLDLVDVSSGLGGWRRPRERTGEGYLISEAQEIQAQTTLPVIGVGGIKTGTYIDELIRAGIVSFAAVGRKILEAPKVWAETEMKIACH